MNATALVESSVDVEDDFELDVRIIEDERPEEIRACATDNGCASTCASSCTSAV